jgi:hypothetical protein
VERGHRPGSALVAIIGIVFVLGAAWGMWEIMLKPALADGGSDLALPSGSVVEAAASGASYAGTLTPSQNAAASGDIVVSYQVEDGYVDPFQPKTPGVGCTENCEGGGGTTGDTNIGTGEATATTVAGTTDPNYTPNPGDTVVRLEAIEPDTEGTLQATVIVAETAYEVYEGDVFATSFQAVTLTAECGTFLFGDDAFDLCVGDEILK